MKVHKRPDFTGETRFHGPWHIFHGQEFGRAQAIGQGSARKRSSSSGEKIEGEHSGPRTGMGLLHKCLERKQFVAMDQPLLAFMHVFCSCLYMHSLK